MTQALQTTTVQFLAKQLDFPEDFVQTVKDVYAKGASDTELKLFLQTAKRTGLDPMARQIYCIKRYDSSLQKTVMSTQVSIDGFRLIADRTGAYVPSKEPTYTFDADGNLESATAYIKKYVGGVWHEVSATAFFAEYVQKTKDGKPNSMWQKMPRLMLAKCAESLVLRKAFPAELSGLYTPEEMGAAEILTEQNSPTTVSKTNHLEPESKLTKLSPILKQLNSKKDSIVWTATKANEYIQELFDKDSLTVETLSDEQFALLQNDLKGRLTELAEQEAIRAETVDGEIIEDISPEQFEEEVF